MKRILVVLGVFSLVMTGCGVKELTDNENDKISEYIAATLLKYDANYEDSLEYDEKLLEPTPAPTPTPAPVATQNPEEGDKDSLEGNAPAPEPELTASEDFSGIFGAMGCNVKAKNFEIVSSYNTDYSVLEPAKGKKLLIVNCQVTNTSGENKKISLQDDAVSYEAEIGEGEYVKPLLTMTLPNDLQNFREKIAAGKSKNAILAFEIDKKDVAQISLTVTYGTKKVMSRITGK